MEAGVRAPQALHILPNFRGGPWGPGLRRGSQRLGGAAGLLLSHEPRSSCQSVQEKCSRVSYALWPPGPKDKCSGRRVPTQSWGRPALPLPLRRAELGRLRLFSGRFQNQRCVSPEHAQGPGLLQPEGTLRLTGSCTLIYV